MQQPRLFVRKFHQKEIYKYYSHNNHTWFTFITTRRRLFFYHESYRTDIFIQPTAVMPSFTTYSYL